MFIGECDGATRNFELGFIEMRNRQMELELWSQVGVSWVNGPVVAKSSHARAGRRSGGAGPGNCSPICDRVSCRSSSDARSQSVAVRPHSPAPDNLCADRVVGTSAGVSAAPISPWVRSSGSIDEPAASCGRVRSRNPAITCALCRWVLFD